MRKPSSNLVSLLVLLCIHASTFSQTLPEVTKPKLNVENNKLFINFDIQNSKSEDIFKVWIEVTDTNNNAINALALSGDYGQKITGGQEKIIVWDYHADNVTMDIEVSLQVYAELLPPIEPVIKETTPKEVIIEDTPSKDVIIEGPAQNDVINEDTPAKDVIIEDTPRIKSVSLGRSVYKSVLLPGLGFTGMDKSKLHLAKGIAGYSFFASAIVLNRMSAANYKKYDMSNISVDRNSLYETSKRQDNLSEAFAYTAIGIWAVELVWILLENRAVKGKKDLYQRNVSLAPGYDSLLDTPCLYLSYKF